MARTRLVACAAAVIGMAAGLGTSPASAMTLSEYLDHGRAQPAATLDVYFTGLRDGLYDYNAAMQTAGIRVFCPPEDGPPMEAGDLHRRIDAFIDEHKPQADFDEIKDAPLGLIGVQLLNEAYACPDEGEDAAPDPGADGEQPDGAGPVPDGLPTLPGPPPPELAPAPTPP